MKRAILLPVAVVVGVAAMIFAERPETRQPRVTDAGLAMVTTTSEILTDIVAYRDPDLDFGMAVPAGWTPLIAAEGDDEVLEPGYIVGFEAPRDGPDDVFADYVMIEILPGRESGQFVTDGSRRKHVTIDDVDGSMDSLVVDDHRIGDATLHLVVHQAEIRGLGYTVGFYAIGESSRAPLLRDAFELMIRTFHLPAVPFTIS